MKFSYMLFSLIIFAAFVSCDNNGGSAKETVPGDTVAQISFRSESAELGKIPFKTHANHDFVFSNTGNSPLTIKEVRGSCHCVQGKWPDQPINPGDSAIISVSFDPEEVTGLFIRTKAAEINIEKMTQINFIG